MGKIEDWISNQKKQWESCVKTFSAHWKTASIASLLGMFLCHALFLSTGNTSPDGVGEGLYFYEGQDWALCIGRWMMRYLSAAGCRVVMPAVFLFFNALCTAVVVLLLADLWKCSSKWFVALSAVALVTAPSVIEQCLVIYMMYDYGFSMLMMTMAAYLVLTKKGKAPFVTAAVCLALGLAGYQAWIGFAAGIVAMTLILQSKEERPAKEILQTAAKAIGMALTGGAAYFVILKLESRRYHIPLGDKGGLNSFGVKSLSQNLVSGTLQAYKDFGLYFTQGPNRTGAAFFLVLLGTVVLLAVTAIHLAHSRKMAQAGILIVLVVLLPFAINVVDVIVPGEINVLMSHPMQMLLPFALVLTTKTFMKQHLKKLAGFVAGGAVALVCWHCTITAYASYQTVATTYRYVGTLTSAILTRVLNDTRYTQGTRLLIAGIPDEKEAQVNNPLFERSAYVKNMIFWNGASSMLGGWENYIYDYYGIWTGKIEYEEYAQVVNSAKFEEMPVYPADGSVQKFDDILVVKLVENPPQ